MARKTKKALRSIIIDPVDEYLINELKGKGIEVDYKPHIPKHDLIKLIANYDILIGRNRLAINKSLISRAVKLKIVVRAGTGIEDIDVEYLREEGITLVSAPGSATDSVAELAIGLMIMSARDILNDASSLKSGIFRKEMGSELSGKTLGVIGFGRIGSRIVELSKAFKMRIIATDTVDLKKKAEEMAIEFLPIDQLLSESDIISMNMNVEAGGKPVIDKEAFKRMKKGVIIVNTSRAAAVDMKELKKSLKSRKVGFYATDVLWEEPPKRKAETELIKDKRFIATSHIGAQTAEAQRRVAESVAENLSDAIKKLGY